MSAGSRGLVVVVVSVSWGFAASEERVGCLFCVSAGSRSFVEAYRSGEPVVF